MCTLLTVAFVQRYLHFVGVVVIVVVVVVVVVAVVVVGIGIVVVAIAIAAIVNIWACVCLFINKCRDFVPLCHRR